ncbi:hypothetical protein E5E91_05030 [Deinococcus radiodurans R1 = ATCC 13939 = DSM 20539]|nr:hypothetical protein E5E91_05030 [Deinococcus radiodurans R1 = ATCC 13939 = DSM 20539]
MIDKAEARAVSAFPYLFLTLYPCGRGPCAARGEGASRPTPMKPHSIKCFKESRSGTPPRSSSPA